VAGWAAGPLGAESIQSRRPRVDQFEIQRDLELVGEGLVLLRHAEGFDIIARSRHPQLDSTGSGSRAACSLATTWYRSRSPLTASRLVGLELKRVASRAPRSARSRFQFRSGASNRGSKPRWTNRASSSTNASPGLLRARRAVQSAREKLVKKLEAMLRAAEPQAVPVGRIGDHCGTGAT
jgi:hypothetical protein